MPTPFYHLSIADELLQNPGVPKPIRGFLDGQRCVFYLGNTAPDVQVISGQSRQSTHFFGVPPKGFSSAWKQLFKKHPGLADAEKIPPDQAAFIAGYICHLQADMLWIKKIFLPYFVKKLKIVKIRRNLYLHNILRTHLDEQIINALPDEIGNCLQKVIPWNWLPFVEDEHISAWRDLIADQLHPGSKSKTVEVFAKRLGISSKDFTDLLHSKDMMEKEIFALIPQEVLVKYRQELIAKNITLLTAYLEMYLTEQTN